MYIIIFMQVFRKDVPIVETLHVRRLDYVFVLLQCVMDIKTVWMAVMRRTVVRKYTKLYFYKKEQVKNLKGIRD